MKTLARRGMGLLFFPVPLLAPGCGGLTLSAGSTEDAAPSADAGCGFSLESDNFGTTVAAASALAFPGGTEIPFLNFECIGYAGGTLYTVTGQYAVGEGSTQMSLDVGMMGGESRASAACAIEGTLRSPPDAGGYPFAIGTVLLLRFSCDFPPIRLSSGKTTRVKLTDGYFGARLMRPEP